MEKRRLSGARPRIGMRPVIDRHRGDIRELPKEETIVMSRRVVEFYTPNVLYNHGTPMECLLADLCIGGASEAATTNKMFKHVHAGTDLPVAPYGCYGFPEGFHNRQALFRPASRGIEGALSGIDQMDDVLHRITFGLFAETRRSVPDTRM